MKKTFFLLWLSVGILLSWMAAAILLTPFGSLDDFYDYGNVCDYTANQINTLSDTAGFTVEGAKLKIAGTFAQKNIYIRDIKHSWSYLYIFVSDMEPELLPASLRLYDRNSEFFYGQTIRLVPGKNEIAIPPSSIAYFSLRFTNVQNASFYINSIQLTEKKIYTPFTIFILFFSVLAAYCCFGIFLPAPKKRLAFSLYKKMFCHICSLHFLLQEIWQLWVKYLPIGYEKSKQHKEMIRRICFVIILMAMLITSKFFNYNHSYPYRFLILIACICLFTAGCMCLEGTETKRAAQNPLTVSWIILCIMMCISDFIVTKKMPCTGYWMLFIWGFFFWAWGNARQPLTILKEWLDAFEFVFWIAIFYCLVCTARVPCYTGMTNNPNTLGEFMSISIVILLGKLLEIRQNSSLRIIILALAMDFALYFTIMSQCRAAILTDGLIALLFFDKKLHSKANAKNREIKWKALFYMVVLWLPISWCSDYIMDHNHCISDHFANTVETAMEPVITEEEIVYAASMPEADGKIILGIKNYVNMDQFSTGRISIYKKYLSDLNLFGHYTSNKVGGTRIGAHNSILTMGYRYGIFTVLPYISLLVYSCIYGIRYMLFSRNHRNMYGFTVFGLLFSSIFCGMLDNLEQPMRYAPWYVFYFITGFFFYWDWKGENPDT